MVKRWEMCVQIDKEGVLGNLPVYSLSSGQKDPNLGNSKTIPKIIYMCLIFIDVQKYLQKSNQVKECIKSLLLAGIFFLIVEAKKLLSVYSHHRKKVTDIFCLFSGFWVYLGSFLCPQF